MTNIKLKIDKRSGIYKAHIKTPSGVKQATTGQTNLKAAKAVLKSSGLEDLALKAQAGVLSHQAVSQILSGSKDLTLESTMPEWIDWMQHRSRSPVTITCSQSWIKAWINHSQIGHLHPSAITEKHVWDYVNSPDHARAISRRPRLAAIRSYFTWATAKGHVLRDPSADVSIDYAALPHEAKELKAREPITDEQLAQLILGIQSLIKDELYTSAQLQRRLQTEPDLRTRDRLQEDLALAQERRQIYTFWEQATIISRWTGLRLSDIACLEWASLANPDRIIVWTRKRDRRIKLPRRPKALADALAAIEKTDDRYCFPIQRRLVLDAATRSNLPQQFKRLCDRFGLPGKSFHCLRHAYATDAAARGWPIEHIRQDLGHSQERTTRGYIHD